MKTTFKKVFNEFDDELINIDEANLSDVEVDVRKISNDVFARIGENKSKKHSKKITVLLVAAVILLIGTVGVFALKDARGVFGGLFNKGSNTNSLVVYDGGDVKVNSKDESLEAEVLGVTGDGERMFSAIQITRKDGGPVIDEEYQHFSNSTSHDFAIRISKKDGEQVKAYSNARFELADNNRVLKVYFYSFGITEDVKDGRAEISGSFVIPFKKDRVLASMDLPMSLNEVDEAGTDKYWFDEALLEEKRDEFGLKEEDCVYFDSGEKREYCQGSFKKFELPIDMSFDIDYSTDNFTQVSLDEDSTNGVAESYAENVKLTITPFGVNLTGQFDGNKIQSDDTYVSCMKQNRNDDSSRIVLDDGTVYYLYSLYGSEQEVDDNGVITEKYSLHMNTVPGTHYEMRFIVIDTNEVKEVYVNDTLIYSK